LAVRIEARSALAAARWVDHESRVRLVAGPAHARHMAMLA
jgi:hypothetical protein